MAARAYPEQLQMDEHHYRLTICTRHRPTRRADGATVCAHPWCGDVLATTSGVVADRALDENRDIGIRTLLDSLRACLDATTRRHAMHDALRWKGIQSFSFDRRTGLLQADAGVNLVVISGRRISGRRAFSISGDTPPAAISAMGMDTATANPTEATTQLDATAANRSIKTFDAGFATITAQDISPVKLTTQGTWTEADNPGPKTFVVRRIGLLNATDNVARTLYSLLGGTVPTTILELNLTGLASFTMKPQIEVTLSNQSAQ